MAIVPPRYLNIQIHPTIVSNITSLYLKYPKSQSLKYHLAKSLLIYQFPVKLPFFRRWARCPQPWRLAVRPSWGAMGDGPFLDSPLEGLPRTWGYDQLGVEGAIELMGFSLCLMWVRCNWGLMRLM